MASPFKSSLHFLGVTTRIVRRIAANPAGFLDDIDRIFNPRHHLLHFRQLPGVEPLNTVIDPALSESPRLNVLLPSLMLTNMSGGPNTAINLTYRMATQGLPVRFISTDTPIERDEAALWDHFEALTGIGERPRNIEIRSAYNRSKPLAIGKDDVFCATAWWTAQMVKHAQGQTNPKKFLYIIQDFEPGFYRWSTEYALALETYRLNFRALINEQLLADYLCTRKIGRFADPTFIDQCAVFEPALDRQKFFPDRARQEQGHRLLLFYSRPSHPRNLFELGLYAIRLAAASGLFVAKVLVTAIPPQAATSRGG